MQVIEGNSRLAAFRQLHKKTGDEKWSQIPCNCVKNLTPEQQDAYLNQIHVKGKTPWAAFEKANFVYTRKKEGVAISEIARRFSVSEQEVGTCIKVVSLMEGNGDKEKSHFSYYDALVRSRKINQSSGYTSEVKKRILQKIKKSATKDADDAEFKAQEMRDKLPAVLAKKKVLQKFLDGTLTLDEAYQNARQSDPSRKIRQATATIDSISKKEIARLEMKDINSLLLDTRKLTRAAERVHKMVQKVKEENA